MINVITDMHTVNYFCNTNKLNYTSGVFTSVYGRKLQTFIM